MRQFFLSLMGCAVIAFNFSSAAPRHSAKKCEIATLAPEIDLKLLQSEVLNSLKELGFTGKVDGDGDIAVETKQLNESEFKNIEGNIYIMTSKMVSGNVLYIYNQKAYPYYVIGNESSEEEKYAIFAVGVLNDFDCDTKIVTRNGTADFYYETSTVKRGKISSNEIKRCFEEFNSMFEIYHDALWSLTEPGSQSKDIVDFKTMSFNKPSMEANFMYRFHRENATKEGIENDLNAIEKILDHLKLKHVRVDNREVQFIYRKTAFYALPLTFRNIRVSAFNLLPGEKLGNTRYFVFDALNAMNLEYFGKASLANNSDIEISFNFYNNKEISIQENAEKFEWWMDEILYQLPMLEDFVRENMTK